nr:MAG TPA: hypothetical protein [Bacteriophage sp.]
MIDYHFIEKVIVSSRSHQNLIFTTPWMSPMNFIFTYKNL